MFLPSSHPQSNKHQSLCKRDSLTWSWTPVCRIFCGFQGAAGHMVLAPLPCFQLLISKDGICKRRWRRKTICSGPEPPVGLRLPLGEETGAISRTEGNVYRRWKTSRQLACAGKVRGTSQQGRRGKKVENGPATKETCANKPKKRK